MSAANVPLTQRRINRIANIPWWMSMLGVTATILPPTPEEPGATPVLVIGSIAGAFAVPLDREQRAALDVSSTALELAA